MTKSKIKKITKSAKKNNQNKYKIWTKSRIISCKINKYLNSIIDLKWSNLGSYWVYVNYLS
jgi:hypothetical protein